MNVKSSIVIDRPIEQVWAYLDDHANELEWRSPSLRRLHQVGNGPAGVGTRYGGGNPVGRREDPYVKELNLYETPTRVSWKASRSAGGGVGSTGSCHPGPGGGRTR